jgi:hypothetical protein
VDCRMLLMAFGDGGDVADKAQQWQQSAFGDVDNDRQQQIKFLGGEDNDRGLGRCFGRGGV